MAGYLLFAVLDLSGKRERIYTRFTTFGKLRYDNFNLMEDFDYESTDNKW